MGSKVKKNQFLKEYKTKDQVNDLFMVKYLSVMESRDGKNYLNVILADQSGDLEARKWNGAKLVAEKISRGDFVKVSGKVNNFQNRLQIIIAEIELFEGDVDRADFVPKAATAPDKMFEELLALVGELNDVYIKDLLESVLFEPELQRRLKIWYAGKSIHHCYESGLLEHILSCAQLAFSLSEHYKVNRNYVVAGAVLHDLCKIYELTEGPLVEYTEEGKLVGHLVKALELLDHHCGKIKGFPYQTKIHLKHILLSHHGEYEFGSPKVPQTSEAFLVHLIDLMDSKMNSLEIIKKNDNSTGRWSGYIKFIDRVVYKEELPFHSAYIKEGEPLKDHPKPQQRPKEKRMSDAPLKQSLADKLKDLKLED